MVGTAKGETVPLTSVAATQDVNNTTGTLQNNNPTSKSKTEEAADLDLDAWIRENVSQDCNHGKIAFQGITRQSMSKFIRLQKSDVGVRFDKVYQLMTEKWKMDKPGLIVSVTGGAKNFDINNEVMMHFKDMILKISQIPGAWLVTGGTHAGVMKHVGDAIREESTAVCVGIPTWGVVKNNEKLLNPQDSSNNRMFPYHVGAWLKAKKEAYLNPNHTHFLLFDDGTTKFGGEIKFRANFERYITVKDETPYVLVVLNGGRGTFKTVYETVACDTKGVPVVLAKGSGRVADLLCDMVQQKGKHWKDLIEDESFKAEIQRVEDIEAKWKALVDKKDSGLFIVTAKENEQGINDAIMDALLSVNQKEGRRMTTFKYLELALLWNRPHILRKELPINEPETFQDKQGNGGDQSTKPHKKISFEKLEILLVMALARGNVDFVELLLLEYEVDIQEVLTMEVLELLYGYQSHEKNFPSGFHDIINPYYTQTSEYTPERRDYVKDVYHYSTTYDFDKGKCTLKVEGIHKLRVKFFGNTGVRNTIIEKELFKKIKEKIRENPLLELFIWATVCNLPQMAQFLWPFEGHQIAKALMASKFCGKLASDENLYHEKQIISFSESEEMFKVNAMDLLEQCYDDDEQKTTKLITTTLDQVPDTTCIELAVDLKHQEFLAHSCAQNVLTDVWTGKMKLKEVVKKDYLMILIAFCFPFLINIWFNFQEPEETPDESTSVQCPCPAWRQGNWKNIKGFYLDSPVVRYLVHLVAYLLFLILYSYVILRERVRDFDYFHLSEILLCVVVFGHFTSEIYQMTQYDEQKVMKKLERWFSDKYNKYDFFLLTVFIVAVALRFSETTVGIAHTIHSVNCGFWILRITTALRVSAVFGAYLEMIHIMMGNLKDFLVILLFAILAYGIMSTSLLYPGGSISTQLLTVVMRPWFHIYGDNFVDMEASSNSTTHFGTPKQNEYAEYVVWLLQGFYLVLTNILLLNVIIAVFNSSYNRVIQQGSKTWKFERYHVIVEYSQRLTAPPPICVIPHLYLFIRKLISFCLYGSCPIKRYSNEELKRKVKNEEEKVELTQFECDCARVIQKRRGKVTDRKVVTDLVKNKKRKVTELDTLELNGKEIKDIKETVVRLERDKNNMQVTIEGLEKGMKDIKSTLEAIHEKIMKD